MASEHDGKGRGRATVGQFLAIEAATFGTAALLHAGVLLRGHQHPKARNAEAVIGLVLVVALVLSQVWPRAQRGVALGAQGFALAGTGLGIVFIAIGVGPRSVLDFGSRDDGDSAGPRPEGGRSQPGRAELNAMWSWFPLVLRSLSRNRRRVILTIASMTVSMGLVGVLIALAHALSYGSDTDPAAALVPRQQLDDVQAKRDAGQHRTASLEQAYALIASTTASLRRSRPRPTAKRPPYRSWSASRILTTAFDPT